MSRIPHRSANERTVSNTQQQRSHSSPIEMVTAERLLETLQYVAKFRLKERLEFGAEASSASQGRYIAAFNALDGLPAYQWRQVQMILKSASKVRCSRDYVL